MSVSPRTPDVLLSRYFTTSSIGLSVSTIIKPSSLSGSLLITLPPCQRPPSTYCDLPCFQVLDGPSFDFSGPFARKNEVKFVSMMEMARDQCAGGNLVDVWDHLLVGDTNKIALSEGS